MLFVKLKRPDWCSRKSEQPFQKLDLLDYIYIYIYIYYYYSLFCKN